MHVDVHVDVDVLSLSLLLSLALLLLLILLLRLTLKLTLILTLTLILLSPSGKNGRLPVGLPAMQAVGRLAAARIQDGADRVEDAGRAARERFGPLAVERVADNRRQGLVLAAFRKLLDGGQEGGVKGKLASAQGFVLHGKYLISVHYSTFLRYYHDSINGYLCQDTH